MRKPNTSRRKQQRAHQSSVAIQQGLPHLERSWVTGPTLRKMLNISSVTLWRWRHRKSSEFPAAKSINSRLYFYWPDVQAWLDKQPFAA
jgi:predicted DNA-binding transcriptional regulator AlpA